MPVLDGAGDSAATEATFRERRRAVPRIDTPHARGTRCTFPPAVAAYGAGGLEPLEVIGWPKAFITRAVEAAIPVGGRAQAYPLYLGRRLL